MLSGNIRSPNNPNQDVDPRIVYGLLPDDRRVEIAKHYLHGFQDAGGLQVPPQFQELNPEHVTVEDMVAMHEHARQHHPCLLERIKRMLTGQE